MGSKSIGRTDYQVPVVEFYTERVKLLRERFVLTAANGRSGLSELLLNAAKKGCTIRFTAIIASLCVQAEALLCLL